MTLLLNELPGDRIPGGMVKVRWMLKSCRSIDTVEIDDVDRIRASQLVLSGDRVYDVTAVERRGGALVAHCWPAPA